MRAPTLILFLASLLGLGWAAPPWALAGAGALDVVERGYTPPAGYGKYHAPTVHKVTVG